MTGLKVQAVTRKRRKPRIDGNHFPFHNTSRSHQSPSHAVPTETYPAGQANKPKQRFSNQAYGGNRKPEQHPVRKTDETKGLKVPADTQKPQNSNSQPQSRGRTQDQPRHNRLRRMIQEGEHLTQASQKTRGRQAGKQRFKNTAARPENHIRFQQAPRAKRERERVDTVSYHNVSYLIKLPVFEESAN